MPGPAPKDPSRRARRNKDPHPISHIRAADPSPQPGLPTHVEWHPATVEWWRVWKDAPQVEHFTVTDWQAALATARIHTAFWTKPTALLATELRQREVNMGATIGDRLKLRMQEADADEKDAKRTAPSSRSRRGGSLHSLEQPDAVETA